MLANKRISHVLTLFILLKSLILCVGILEAKYDQKCHCQVFQNKILKKNPFHNDFIKGEFYKQIYLKFCHIKKGEIVS